MRAREVNRKIERNGGIAVRTVGSHRRYVVRWKDADGNERTAQTTVAQHPGDIPTGTLHKIERDLEEALGKGWLRR